MAFRGPARLLPLLVRAVDPVAEEGVGAVVLGRDSIHLKIITDHKKPPEFHVKKLQKLNEETCKKSCVP